jgi:glycine betaine/proline transport system permease protein/glycine betaine/proline transport system substrate-binding protein
MGIWDLMLLTLAIMLAGVIIALALGFPIASSYPIPRGGQYHAPVLDTMQTMPVFVYTDPGG